MSPEGKIIDMINKKKSILMSDYFKKPNAEIQKYIFAKNYYGNFIEYTIFFCPDKYNSRHEYDKNVCKKCGFDKFNYEVLFGKYGEKIIPEIIRNNSRKKNKQIVTKEFDTTRKMNEKKKEVINEKIIDEISANMQIDKNFLLNFGLSSRYYKDQITVSNLNISDNERLYKLENYIRIANMTLRTKITNYEDQSLEFLINRLMEIYNTDKHLFKEIYEMDKALIKEKIKSEIQDEIVDHEDDDKNFAPDGENEGDSSDDDAEDVEEAALKKDD